MFIIKPDQNRCWICGSTGPMSKEHKYKASDLRRVFGSKELSVGRTGERLRVAQGVNSKYLKYQSSICKVCNSERTQESDRAYDRFISEIAKVEMDDAAVQSVLAQPTFSKDDDQYIALFRYFAKLLGCHLSDMDAPIPRHLARFVAKKSSLNCILLWVRPDPNFPKLLDSLGEKPSYAAHGGVVIAAKLPKLLPTRLQSTLTIGPTQFVYWYKINAVELVELRIFHKEFIAHCANSAQREIDEPHSEEQWNSVGIIRN